ncbi:MAG: class I SAM-dependent methyltransferase [Candidatus Tectomicrobia bacterium]|nr:class I SAM-dependent methyltransferase [Candidatus Tectomicrobia bacterium]
MPEPTTDEQMQKVRTFERGFIGVLVILTGTELGLFAALERAGAPGLTAAELAARLGLHAPYVRFWCETAYALELLDADAAGRFQLQPNLGEVLVDESNPRNLAASLRFSGLEVYKDLVRFPEFFRSGATFTYQDHDASLSHAVADITKNFYVVFVGGVTKRVRGMRERLGAGARFLEIGCGAGALPRELAKRYPASRFTGVDSDRHAIQRGREGIAAEGLGDRVTLLVANGAAFGEAASFDYVSMVVTLHEVRADDKEAVLRNAHRVLRPGGVFLNLDFSYPARREELRQPEFSYGVMDQYMEMVWGNRHLSIPEVRALVERCGFRDLEQHPFNQGAFTLTVGVKPGET